MIPDSEIAAMKDPSQGNTWADDVRALKRLLAEREVFMPIIRLARTADGVMSEAGPAFERFHQKWHELVAAAEAFK